MDYISGLPESIIEGILCLVPIKEAARTSILSKEWRYHWTKIPKLVFDEKTFQASTRGAELEFSRKSQRKRISKRCKLFYAIFQVLLLHKGTINEFSLSMKADESCIEIDQIVHHLSLKNTVKKLTLDLSLGYSIPLYNSLPSYIFSMTQLTDIYVSGCAIDPQATSSRLALLTTLYVPELRTTKEKLLEFLSKSPLLKTVTLDIGFDDIEYSGDSDIIDLFECLPVIENLSIWYGILKCFDQYEVPQKLPTALVHLKYFCLEDMCFIQKHDKMRMLYLVIKSSPNLEKLKLQMLHGRCKETTGSFSLKDYSDIWLEHLNEFEIRKLSKKKKTELDFVKLILAKSPVLKKVKIFIYEEVSKSEFLEISRILSRSWHVSPKVDIIFDYHSKDKIEPLLYVNDYPL